MQHNQSKLITIGLSFKQLGQDDMPVWVSSTASIVNTLLALHCIAFTSAGAFVLCTLHFGTNSEGMGVAFTEDVVSAMHASKSGHNHRSRPQSIRLRPTLLEVSINTGKNTFLL